MFVNFHTFYPIFSIILHHTVDENIIDAPRMRNIELFSTFTHKVIALKLCDSKSCRCFYSLSLFCIGFVHQFLSLRAVGCIKEETPSIYGFFLYFFMIANRCRSILLKNVKSKGRLIAIVEIEMKERCKEIIAILEKQGTLRLKQGKCRLCISQTLFFHNVQRHLFLQLINNINRRKSEFLIKNVIICDLE